MQWSINRNGQFTGEFFNDMIVYPLIGDHGPGPGDPGFTKSEINKELERRNNSSPTEEFSADFYNVSWPIN